MSDANITIVGTAGRDPELRYAASGLSTARFSVAVNYRRQNRQTNEWDESTSWMNVVCFGSLADNVAESVQKGVRVIASGRLEVRDYETNDGTKGRAVDLIADEVGASLKWATAKVEKAERREGGAPGNSRQPANAPSGPSNAGASHSGSPSGGGYSYDEEPF